jgi:hypothetical protein
MFGGVGLEKFVNPKMNMRIVLFVCHGFNLGHGFNRGKQKSRSK